MMYRVRDSEGLCVLRVDRAVLDLPGVWYSTRNASTDEAEFYGCNGHFDHLDADIYAGSWLSSSGAVDHDKMQRMQAEILVPRRVPPELIECVYAKNEEDRGRLRGRFPSLDARLYPGIFFDE